MKFFLLVLFVALTSSCFGQNFTLSGIIKDVSSEEVLAQSTVTLLNTSDSLDQRNTLADSTGSFRFDNVQAGRYTIAVTNVGYQQVFQKVNVLASNKEPIIISLTKDSKFLDEVVVVGQTPGVVQKGDSLEFSASQLKVNPDATAEDMVRKLPGVTIDKNGNVTAMGEQVKKVTVDGKDFFGDDATATLRNLPASIIDKIQVFERLSEQASFTGFDDGSGVKAINIVTKANMRNGQFGRVYAGAGTRGTYTAGGNVSAFNKDLRVTLVGLSNNINQQNFAAEDLLGVNSGGGGGGRRGGRGGGAGGFGGNDNNFSVPNQSGISHTNSIGLTVSNTFSPKLDVAGSYFFNQANLRNAQFTRTQYIQANGINQFYQEQEQTDNSNANHRANLRLNYKMDERNTIVWSPSISYQQYEGSTALTGQNNTAIGELLSKASNTNTNSNNGYNLRNNLLYRHAFLKKGRTISLNLNTTLNNKQGEQLTNNTNQYFDTVGSTTDLFNQEMLSNSKGWQLSGNVAYTEPIGKKGQLQINYSPSYSVSDADQRVYEYETTTQTYSRFDENLSNVLVNDITKHNAGTSYRVGDRDNMFSIGLNYQYTLLESNQTYPFATTVSQDFHNLLPNLMWRKKLNTNSSLRLYYRASTNTPSISQLQEVYNITNPLFISTGNKDLKQQNGHVLSARYNYTNVKKGNSLFANLFLSQNNNYITTATYTARKDSVLNSSVILYKGSQLSYPVNLNGYYNLRSLVTYAFPIKPIKSNLSVNAGYNYTRTPGLINEVRNESKNSTATLGAVLASNISEYVDFNIHYNASLSNAINSIQAQQNNRYVSQSAGILLNLLSKNGWLAQTSVSHERYAGYTDGFNQNYTLWNAAIGKKLLTNKSLDVRVTAFDILKQNQSIQRSVTESYIRDVQSQVLQQYFMLQVTYTLKNFGKANERASSDREEGGDRPRGLRGNRD